MSLLGLTAALRERPAYRELLARLRAGDTPTATVVESAKPYVVASLWRDAAEPMLVICPHPADARRLVEQLEAYCGDDAPIYHFAESEVLPYERLSVEAGTVHERMAALGALHGIRYGAPPEDDEPLQPPLIVASVTGLMQKTLSPKLFGELVHEIRRDQKIAIDATFEKWARMGYRVGPAVEEPGAAARRGGLIDVYPPGHPQPVRIDLWGDRVDTIRPFDVRSQRSSGEVGSVTLLPAAELLPSLADHDLVDSFVRGLDFSGTPVSERDRMADELAELMAGLSTDQASLYSGFLLHHTLLDHLVDVRDAAVIINEPSEVDEAARRVESNAEKLRLTKQERGELPLGFPSGLAPWDGLREQLGAAKSKLELSRYHQAETGGAAIALPLSAAPAYQGVVADLIADLRSGGLASVVVGTQHSRRLEELLRDAELGVREGRSLQALPEPGVAEIVHAAVAGGWSLVGDEMEGDHSKPTLTLLTDVEIFGTSKRRVTRARRHASKVPTITPDELTPGQYVVHTDHGIARFVGTTAGAPSTSEADVPVAPAAAAADETGREYLVLEYAQGDRLYVPMEHLNRVSLYVGGEDSTPAPTRLGTQEWTRAVSRARESTKKLALDLLALYAEREAAVGIAHEPDTPWQREVEDSFPYVETPDQETAIEQVKDDLEQPRPMDRLVCGDVGYGKTEVALRAAFKAVMSGKQVAILVPTTVLAQQHYQTFTERLGPFPVTVEVLSRFRTAKDQDAVVERLKTGDVDIVIGTHRLVQKDVGFKDLGLIIIDEEHRFGVGHKERLKELRREVDVLTLTATPIPRTLHMALAGIRDISTIDTPPEERLPIKTYLAEASDDLIREAVLRELDRGGQVFYLHNRVKTIDLVAQHIRDLVPDARVMVGHGQMPEEELANVMADFAEGGADVLVCTTIIESGLDIPAVNTLIIDRADRLGLAQLYQLRGRIGRRSQRAYAYLMVERGRRLTEVAQRRLQTIVAASELGAGFRIAMKDLEIRGAGNILGAEQSGQIHAVGFDLYTRLLAEAVAELRESGGVEAGTSATAPDPIVDLGLPAAIPDDLVPHMPTRMSMYQRMAKARTIEEVNDLPREFQDRFGHQLPDELHHLVYGVRVRVLARRARVESVVRRRDRITIKLMDQVGGARVPLEDALGHGTDVGNQQVHMPASGGEVAWGQALLEVLERIESFQGKIADMEAAASAC